MGGQETAEFVAIFFIFALVVAWFTGDSFADVGLIKGAAMLVKIPFQIGGVIKSVVGGDLGATAAFIFMVVFAFPALKNSLGEPLFAYILVATTASIILGTFF
ncbi:MAG: hypothetical protein NTY90_03795 [Candidatus Micrarchaeota archaeon]|nr:hypothetical protein [Candidatus Micrarchaeota archaeon]